MENTWNHLYPRPQLKRNSFLSLNGEWSVNQQSIIIPFPPQSSLSNYQGDVPEHLHYEKQFTLPNNFLKSDKVLLHFGAVDQIATIYLNGHFIGEHRGGYLPFSFDIKEYLIEGENQLVVDVIDTLSHDYPYGKQRKKRGGMWYTPVSGIWQSVWLEAVPQDYIQNLKIIPSLKGIHLDVQTNAKQIKITIPLKNKTYQQTFISHHIDIDLSKECQHLSLWTPEHPYLYPLIIETEHDHVESYFALRTIHINDQKQLCLNNEPIFLHGVLDQGYFHDGLFLPQTPDSYIQDILNMKELGFNTLRKHIKIEPDIFYYYCDQYGMLAIQDMVNNGGYNYLFDTVLPNIGLKYRPDSLFINQKRKEIFKNHMKDTLEHLYNHPCIVIYTLFNEGWGQCNADEMYQLAKSIDSSRLYDSTSGWFQQKESDFDSQHVYFRNKTLSSKKSKPILLSECGGYTRFIEDHVYNSQAHYGYGKTNTEEELTEKIIQLYKEMVIPSLQNGLCGCIYTQVSDIEDEINGLYTYDRKICKVNKDKMNLIRKLLFSH